MNSTVVKLERSQLDSASAMLSAAFAADPLFNYLTSPLNAAQSQIVQQVCRAVLTCALRHQHTYTTNLLQGVAAWIPPGQAPISLLELLQAGLYRLPFQMPWPQLWRWLPLLKWDDYRQQDMPHPHWYLALLGVSPDHQRQGVGSRLLQPIVSQADRQGLPCYLETSTESAVRFYQSHGFQIIRSAPYTRHAPPFWTMYREPQTV